MQWTARMENVGRKPNQKRLRVYFSDCKRYAILRIKKGRYELVESDAHGGSYYVTPENSNHTTLAAAKAQAEQEEAVRLKIWHYFEARAKRSHESDAEIRTNKDYPACKLVIDEAHKRANWTVEQYAAFSYAYTKYRALLTITGLGKMPIDPAARRDWMAMLDGTYKQYWERTAS